MFQGFLSFLRDHEIKTSNPKMKEVVESYTFLVISEENELEQNSKIENNLKESKVIIISHYEEHKKEKDDRYFVLSFRRTILVIKETRIKILQTLLSQKEKLEICFLFNTKEIFDDINNQFNETKIKYDEIKNDENFEDEITEINYNFFNKKPQNFPFDDILKIIKTSLSGYLIKQSYYAYDRTKNFNDKIKPREIKEVEIIELRLIGTGNDTLSVLCYHIEYEKLVVIKKYNLSNFNNETLLKREIRNYEEISHPFIPKYYGTIQSKNFPVIEYINGKTLLDTDFSQFSETEIYEIIFQMFLVINYLHNNHFIYRDLKPNNAIIDEFKTFVLIDFDRMIKDDENTNTKDFQTLYESPEIYSNDISNKCDIYSIGKIIDFIIKKSNSMNKNQKNTKLTQICSKCINDKSELRPNSSELIKDFIFFIKNIIDKNKSIFYYSLAANQNNPQAQFILGLIYYEDQYISRDINKSIYYFSLAANQNDPQAQYILGFIYYLDQYIPRDINKAIYYFEKAANQNISQAQFYLGGIYERGQYISRNINKALYYYSLAANQNIPEAQYNLGSIYYSGQYIPRDINKAIYYFFLAANNNYPQAQYNLGLIYYEDKYISRDINKAIYYFEKAANQNIPEAQFNLGLIYEEGQYIPRDINKAIYYFTLAANQNYPQAQFILGNIYEEGQYIPRDINKAIYYYTLVANQNDSDAQYNLGLIYYENKYISRDIKKAIYYFTLVANQNDPDAQYNLGLIYYENKYISRDINKSIYYFEKAAKQNHPLAQFKLGFIYYSGQYISRDINKAIYYFLLASNHNIPEAQYNLGIIYYFGKHISRDINKAIDCFKMAANQNFSEAQFNLGVIYYKDQYIPRDINKSIYYYSLAANQNHPNAQFNLGNIYYYGKYISRDINKAIYYYSLAANQNIPQAQFNLGLIYFHGINIKNNIKRGIYLITQSSINDCTSAHFALGFLYQEGKYLKKNIDESIKYYKKASSFNNQYAKNNLGIIYKNNIENKYDYTVYFEEAIQQKNDPISMYNLSHTYIYKYQDEKLINKSIKLLIKSSNHGFKPSIELLCLIILKKLNNKQKNKEKQSLILKNENEKMNIEKELSKFTKDTSELKNSIINIIHEHHLYNYPFYENYYKKYEEILFIYDMLLRSVCTKDLYKEENEIKLEDSKEEYNITPDFYEGFGNDICLKVTSI